MYAKKECSSILLISVKAVTTSTASASTVKGDVASIAVMSALTDWMMVLKLFARV